MMARQLGTGARLPRFKSAPTSTGYQLRGQGKLLGPPHRAVYSLYYWDNIDANPQKYCKNYMN